jgi:hypothetical protein
MIEPGVTAELKSTPKSITTAVEPRAHRQQWHQWERDDDDGTDDETDDDSDEEWGDAEEPPATGKVAEDLSLLAHQARASRLDKLSVDEDCKDSEPSLADEQSASASEASTSDAANQMHLSAQKVMTCAQTQLQARVNCSGGHGLRAFETEVAGYNCDICLKQDLVSSTTLWGCRICEFDVCEACWHKRADS